MNKSKFIGYFLVVWIILFSYFWFYRSGIKYSFRVRTSLLSKEITESGADHPYFKVKFNHYQDTFNEWIGVSITTYNKYNIGDSIFVDYNYDTLNHEFDVTFVEFIENYRVPDTVFQ
jgi:hypothetical protein